MVVVVVVVVAAKIIRGKERNYSDGDKQAPGERERKHCEPFVSQILQARAQSNLPACLLLHHQIDLNTQFLTIGKEISTAQDGASD